MNIDWNVVLTVFASILTVVATFFSYYLIIKRKIEAEIPGAINNAEDTLMAGAEKLKVAVDTLYSLIPTVVKPFITRDIIEALVQEVFDKMEDFARKQLEKETESNEV